MEHLFNLTDYSVLEHVFFLTGCFMWVVVYLIVIRNIKRFKFIEIPMVAICANFAWEFLWSWVFLTDMGLVYVWGYRVWFILDCFILFSVFRYGYKQLVNMPKKSYLPLLVGGLMASFLLLYFYIQQYDWPISKMGAYSGYVLNVMMSALYISLFLRMKNKAMFSLWGAWLKGVGTVLISVFCFLHFDDPFLLSMCVVTAVLDATYMVTFYKAKFTVT